MIVSNVNKYHLKLKELKMYNIFCFRTVVKSSLLDKETVLNLHPMHEFPVSTACSCLRSQASHLGATARPKSSSPSSRLADRFMQSASIINRALEKDQNDGDDDEDNDDEDECKWKCLLFLPLVQLKHLWYII